MSEEQSKAFMHRLSLVSRISRLREDLHAHSRSDPSFRLEALALEAIAVAKERGDATAKAELETVARRVLNRCYLPSESEEVVDPAFPPERYHHAPAKTLSFAGAVRLLSHTLSWSAQISDLAERNYAATRAGVAEYVMPDVRHVLHSYVEHWPGGADDETILAAITEAAIDGRALVKSVLCAWGATGLVVTNAQKNLSRRQK